MGGQIDRWTEGQIDRWKPNLAGNLSGPLCVCLIKPTPLPEFRDDFQRDTRYDVLRLLYWLFIGQKLVMIPLTFLSL